MDTKKHSSLWYKDAVIYELHVKAFYDGNDDGIGDFQGLIRKLDYLQDLGVTALWLLPFYPSPFRDDGYDIADYRGIHAEYGTLRDFRQFVREAHRRGLKVITELVVNHTSDQHSWFQEARRARSGSAKRNYFVWSDTDAKFPETRIIFTDTEKSNWAWDPVAGAYYWHRFFSHQPDLNHNNPSVVRAVIKVLRFWLDMGVDAFRLDAVPYLCVREGTNNENLPETHAVIREIRRQLDQAYTDRMLLAEANQWPEDTVEYFGKGDECHMAFHFPLMPRIYMALRKEDRRPIVEIIERTPAIPHACQWGLFLRNHDELTLEMVTDEERDYMYSEYAADPRMRLNVGIRRRLAPLLDNSRRRMELLNSLLLSFPGTPIIYYGDEIGMGDNIFLGDRNGVRTPMQWSADRNAGFSRTDPSRLYLPVIMDPVYGYGGVNVEAQQRDPSSFLHFMRRMLALRRQYKAFGRGTMEFLHPANRTILAYIRRYKREVILAAANLSRFVQPAELDLSEFRGWTPVEMIGRTEFPPIGDLPYFLTLGPHSFYWFRLEPQAEPLRLAKGGKTIDAAFPRFAFDRNWEGRLEDPFKHVLEKEVLPEFMPSQRWFRGKAREIIEVRLIDWAKLGGGFFIAFAAVSYSDRGKETYCLPLKVEMGADARKLAAEIPEAVLAVFATPRKEGVVLDALADRNACCDLFSAMAENRAFPTALKGKISAFVTRAFEAAEFDTTPCSSVRRLGLEQSNTSIILDDQAILKVYRRVEEGANPDFEIGRYLTERSDFSALAPVAGGILYEAAAKTAALAMLQPFIPNDGDGWTYMLEAAEEFIVKAASLPVEMLALSTARPFPPAETIEIPPPVAKIMGPALAAVANLGERTAEFHLALSREKRLAAFVPEPLDAHYLEGLADGFRRQAGKALALLGVRQPNLSEDLGKKVNQVLASSDSLSGHFQKLAAIRTRAVRIRCHGDYHLGQVLRRGDDWILLDFEGEPLRTLAERREKHSPLKDVAGMLRSFSYAAHNVLFALVGDGEARRSGREAAARAWRIWAETVFLRHYLERSANASYLPDRENHLEMLLRAFILDKSFYELEYELNNRPDWLRIPLDGILAFL